mgnify:CR=1 FL=1
MISQELEVSLHMAFVEARSARHEFITVEHLLFAMLCSDNFYNLLKGAGADVEYLKSNLEHYLKNNLQEIVIETAKYKRVSGQTQILFGELRWGYNPVPVVDLVAIGQVHNLF